ncbi:hypothetical protein LMH73_007925 [Vibrio splendidus]|nr:hypothetical protein [Vibrio splendidus]MCC4883117.1 hypothetical protein [Vibrio splendidus]
MQISFADLIVGLPLACVIAAANYKLLDYIMISRGIERSLFYKSAKKIFVHVSTIGIMLLVVGWFGVGLLMGLSLFDAALVSSVSSALALFYLYRVHIDNAYNANLTTIDGKRAIIWLRSDASNEEIDKALRGEKTDEFLGS